MVIEFLEEDVERSSFAGLKVWLEQAEERSRCGVPGKGGESPRLSKLEA